MKPVWRLLVHELADGHTNMAIDEAMMHTLAAGTAPPTLRFFRWRPPCVSLGYFQSAVSEVDLDACRRLGIDCVRRPTGGRAILHDAELTYSVVARADDPAVSGNILESYRKISLALLYGLRELGVAAEMKPAGRQMMPASPGWASDNEGSGESGRRVATAACFDMPSDYEIAVAGRKLVGSAQTRLSGVLLQHGSLLIEVDPIQIFTVLRPPPGTERAEVAQWLARRVTSLREELDRLVSFEEAATALRHGFAGALDVVLEPGELTDEEDRLTERLRAEKYSSEEWNLKR